MFGIKTQVSSQWKKRLSDVQLFNQYAADHKIVFKDDLLEDFSLSGARFSGGSFVNTDWKDAEFKDAKIENTTFEGGEYRNASFGGSVLRNVVFKNITFYSANFGHAELVNVEFINCNFGRARFHGLENSTIEFKNSVLEEVRFFDSAVDVKYVDSKLTSVGMMGTVAKDYFIVKGSDIYDVNLGSSEIPNVEITDSTIKKATFDGGKARKIVEKNNKGMMDTAGAIVDGDVEFDNIETAVLFISETTAKKIHISNVKVSESVNAGGTHADELTIADSNIRSIWNGGCKLKAFNIINTELRGTRNEGSRIGLFHLENVTLNGKFNFDYTHADKLELVNVTKGPDFQFRGKDSNIHF